MTGKDDKARERVLANIAELGLNENLLELETNGYTVLPGVLSEDRIERAKAAILRRVERTTGKKVDPDTATSEDFSGMAYQHYLIFEDPVFPEILLEPKPLAMITYLLGESCVLSSMGSHFRGPGGMPLSVHADGVRIGMTETSLVANCNYALTPYSREGGALALVPGSHKLGRPPRLDEMGLGDDGNPNAVAMDIDPGDAVVWHGNSWHGSFVREIPGIRMNLAVYFNRQYIQTQERHGNVVPEEVRERHANDTRFLNLLGAKQPYGWQKSGPDYSKFALMPRGLYD